MLNQINFRIIPHTALGFSKINVAHTVVGQLLLLLLVLLLVLLCVCVGTVCVCELSCACAVAAAFSSCFNHLNAAHCFRASPLNTVALYLQRCVLSSLSVCVWVCGVFVSVPALINIIEHGLPEERFVSFSLWSFATCNARQHENCNPNCIVNRLLKWE